MKRFTLVGVTLFLFLWAVPAQGQLLETAPIMMTSPDVVTLDVVAAPEVVKAAVAEPAPVAPVVEEEAVPQPTEPMPVTPAELGETIDKAILAAEGGHWTVLAGFLIMILIWVLRRFGLLAEWSKGIPWLATVVGGVIVFAAYLASGYAIGTAILYAFFSGGSAVTMWELVFKHLDKKTEVPA